MRLQPTQPHDFGRVVTYFTRRAGELVDRIEDGAYRRLFVCDGIPVLAELRPDGSAGLTLCARPADGAADLPAGVCARLAATLTRTLDLANDPTTARAVFEADPALLALADGQAGLRLISTPTAFEAFVWAVLGQQISLHVAFRLKAALVQRLGVCAAVDGGRYWAFPTTHAVAAADPVELAALGLGRRKAATIVGVAGRIAAGEFDIEALAGLPLAEAEAALTALHGVGPWTAHYTLLRGLRVADACPVSDLGLRVACGALYALGRKASVEEVAAYAERWRPYRGQAAFQLWSMLATAGRSDG